MIIVEIETTSIRTDQEKIVCHNIKKILSFQTHKVKTIEAVHQKIKGKSVKYNL